MGLAVSGRPDPRVVLLSPGSHNETYFEHAFLAKHLGISLVEGQDLYVRQGRVWLRTLWGDETVDVILRRVDDDYSDPLEFRGESLLGVAGLTEVARRGNVSIINPLGSGVLENPGLHGFLPRIANYFALGELQLSQVESWWCGDAQSLGHVLNNLKRLIIKPIYREPGMRPVMGDRLSENELDTLRRKIRTKPEAWVAQERLELSTIPCHRDFRLEPYNMLLRGYAVAKEDSDYVVMAGGLTRVSASAESDYTSFQVGSRSKDTWVLSSDDDTEVSLWLHPQHKLADSAPELLVSGRAAENLFWMGRYAERTDAVISLLRVLAAFMVSDGKQALAHIPQNAGLLLPVLTHLTYTYPGFTLGGSDSDYNLRNAELASLFSDFDRPGSVAFNLSCMISASREIHDLLSYETRSIINRIEGQAQSLADRSHVSIEKLLPALTNLKNDILAFNCLIGQSMIRGLAWRFLDLGRRIERALSLIRLQQYTLGASQSDRLDQDLLKILLFTTDNDVNYQQRYTTELSADRVLDLLLMEENNPCSVMYQMLLINKHLENLPDRSNSHILNREERLIVEATTCLRLTDSWEVGKRDTESGLRTSLDGLLSELQQSLAGSADALATHYFKKTTEKQQVLTPVST